MKTSKTVKALFVLASIFISETIFAQTVNGIMLRTSGSLYTLSENDEMKWVKSISSGTTFKVYENSEKIITIKKGQKGEESTSYTKIQYQKNDFYARTREIAAGLENGVITKEAVFYTDSKLSDFTETTISSASIVAVGSIKKYMGISFTEIKFWDAKRWSVRDGFVISSKVTSQEDDLEGAKLLSKIRSTKDDGLKEELFKNAKELKTSSSIREMIQKEEDAFHNISDLSSAGNEEITMTGIIFTEDGADTNVRDLPGTKGNKITKLSINTPVTVTKKTVLTETIEGITSPWYQIKTEDGTEGWIFGGYFKENELVIEDDNIEVVYSE